MNEYNQAAVRELLKDAFTAQDLWRFCQERADFQPILVHFPFNPTLAQMIDALAEYCRTRVLFDQLLAEVRLINPRQYERHQAHLFAGNAIPAAGARIPHNLPPRTEFVGRETEKARIHEALRSRYFLISIEGIGGIGKTSLALEVAYECLHAASSKALPHEVVSFDSFVWATARDRDLTLNALLDAIALTLDYPGIVQRPLEQKVISVQKLLRERPCLLLMDNFETVTDERVWDLLRALPEPSKALITTREQRLGHVFSISLKGLEEPEALRLIRGEGRRLDLKSIMLADDGTLLHLHTATGGAPLAIKWALGQIKQRGQSLETVLSALHEARGSIFEEVFTRSWALLSAQARDVLVVMPIFGTSASREAMEAASTVRHFAFDDALGQLVEMSMVDATDTPDLAPRRYSVHPLTRAFAQAKLDQDADSANTAHRNLADFFQQFSQTHGGFRNLLGFKRLDADLPNVVAVVRWCLDNGLVDQASDIFWHVSPFMVTRGYWHDVMDLAEQIVRRTSELSDELDAARLKVWPIGWIHRHRGDLDAAMEQTALALATYERLGRDAPWAKRNLARIFQTWGDMDQANALLTEALELNERLYRGADSAGEKRKLEQDIQFVKANLAEVALQTADLNRAQALASEALARARELDDPECVASLLIVLGSVALRCSDHHRAKALWEQALENMVQADRRDGIADGQFQLAQLEVQMGESQRAKERLLEALDKYKRLNIPSKVQAVESLLADLVEPADGADRLPVADDT